MGNASTESTSSSSAFLERHSKAIFIGLMVAALLIRAAWAIFRPIAGPGGEAGNVAAAIAMGRGFSDAYQPGQGYTAHLLPVSPGIAGLVYSLLGIRSLASEFILACWSIGLVMASFALYWRAFARLGVALPARILGLAYVCLMPAYIGPESVDFRVWEGGLTVFLMALFLDRLLAAEGRPMADRRSLILLAAIIAILFFVNPPEGAAAAGCALLFGWRRLGRHDFLMSAGATLLFTSILIVPWTVRNDIRLGVPIMLRSNAGLELALANHPGALTGKDRLRVFTDRLGEIHPVNIGPYRRMQQVGGEVRYSQLLGQQTVAWMASHKVATLELAARHVREIYMPEPWQFGIFGSRKLTGLRAVLASLSGVAGLLGLFVALYRRRSGWAYVAIFALMPALELCLFQPIPRYTYLFYGILTFAAVDFFWWALEALRMSSRTVHM